MNWIVRGKTAVDGENSTWMDVVTKVASEKSVALVLFHKKGTLFAESTRADP